MNILKIDTDKLNEEIAVFSVVNGNRNKIPYLICSEETRKLLVSQCAIIGTKEDVEKVRNLGILSHYCGTKVLQDNSLKLGEVEIR